MKILKAYPPNWNTLTKHFPIKGRQGILYAYGDILYNPSGVTLTPWILAHEELHGKRQQAPGMFTEQWWSDYIHFPIFRLREELAAHQREWHTYVEKKGDMQGYYLDAVAKRLSSPLYGSMISYPEARKQIQET